LANIEYNDEQVVGNMWIFEIIGGTVFNTFFPASRDPEIVRISMAHLPPWVNISTEIVVK
jgi:hypothetical protein